MQDTGVEGTIMEGNVCLRGTANKDISGRDYNTMVRAQTMVQAAMFTLHWKPFAKRLNIKEKGLECMSVFASNMLIK